MADNLQRSDTETNVIRDELIAGLTAPRATTSPKYLYDALGSKLFEAICELPEYYPTRTEAAIFERHGAEIARVGRRRRHADRPGRRQLRQGGAAVPVCCRRRNTCRSIFRPISCRRPSAQLQRQFPAYRDAGAGPGFFIDASTCRRRCRTRRRLFFYPGSSIGNFTRTRRWPSCAGCAHAADGGLLIGVDLVKDRAVLDAAYDDALGVTAAFNLNLLRHLNRLLGADFDVREWRHRGFFNAGTSRIEMHLEARRDLTVRWQGGERRFGEGERIHTENSYKYTPGQLCRPAGARPAFTWRSVWTDRTRWFVVCHARRG